METFNKTFQRPYELYELCCFHNSWKSRALQGHWFLRTPSYHMYMNTQLSDKYYHSHYECIYNYFICLPRKRDCILMSFYDNYYVQFNL